MGNAAPSVEQFGCAPNSEAPEHTMTVDPLEERKVEHFNSGTSRKRRGSVSAAPVSEAQLRCWAPPVYAKTPEQLSAIQRSIAEGAQLHVLFGHLSPASLAKVASAMFLRDVVAGETLIRQGDDGDYFYIVHSGAFEIFVQRSSDCAAEKVMEAAPGSSFGELALMYNTPRAATVTCSRPGQVWCLERETFQMMLVTDANAVQREYEAFLAQIDILRDLTKYELAVLSDLLKVELFNGGEEITTQGHPGDKVFILYDGEARAYISGDRGEVEVKAYATQGAFFGEIALLLNEPRRATVRACGSGCSVLSLSRQDLDLSVGSIRERLLSNIEEYPTYSQYLGR